MCIHVSGARRRDIQVHILSVDDTRSSFVFPEKRPENFFFFTLSDVEIDFFLFERFSKQSRRARRRKTARLGKSISGT